LIAYLKQEQFVPYEPSRQFLGDVFGFQLSPGTLESVDMLAAERLQQLAKTIHRALIASEVVHFDESGCYIGGWHHWLHAAGTATLTYYYTHSRHSHRGRQATDAMGILPNFLGRAIYDFWSAYRLYSQCDHGFYSAHHLRELTALHENKQQARAMRFIWFFRGAKKVLARARQLDATAFIQARVAQIERIYAQLVAVALEANPPHPMAAPEANGSHVKATKACNLAERLAAHRPEVLAFVYNFRCRLTTISLNEKFIRLRFNRKSPAVSASGLGPMISAVFATISNHAQAGCERSAGFGFYLLG
jgi:transposase